MTDMALKNRKRVAIFPLPTLFTCMPPSPQRHWLKFNSSLWRSNSGDIDMSCSIQNKLLRINNSRLSCPYLVGHSPRCHFDLDTKFRTRFNQYDHGIKQLEIAAFDHPLEFVAVVRLRGKRAVNICTEHGNVVPLGKFHALADLTFAALLSLVVTRIPSVDDCFHKLFLMLHHHCVMAFLTCFLKYKFENILIFINHIGIHAHIEIIVNYMRTLIYKC